MTDGRITLHHGDCLDVLATLPADHFDACVTDPPYGLEFMGVAWDTYAAPKDAGSKEHPRDAKGQARVFRNKNLASGEFSALWAREVFRVLKPGAHLVAFGGTRTYHRMACAIEDAGFEVRDTLCWLYGSGFPKSHDVSKGIDRAAGAKREVIGSRVYADGTRGSGRKTSSNKYAQDVWTQDNSDRVKFDTVPATDAARQWDGFGTALKPAFEPIILARKPLSEATVAANVLKWGTGAINVDGCRVATDPLVDDPRLGGNGQWNIKRQPDGHTVSLPPATMGSSLLGRWPANVVHDGSEEVMAAFPDAPGQQGYVGPEHGRRDSVNCYGDYGARPPANPRNDSGSAARFFYTAKADSDDRLGSKHPTVKPLDLMQWLVRLVTPPGGLVLDPFAGTGTTGEAAWREGMRAVLIEREAQYQDDIRRRMQLAAAGPAERERESIKAAGKLKTIDELPLFATIREAAE
jgi:site-specific DNA-methyltransferase (adenine-specific)